jgi:2-haloalkanoic acid dehalogenase type II
MDLSQFRVFSFDCYGTMIDWESGILVNLRTWIETQGAELGDVEILESFGVTESTQEAETPDAPYPEILEGVHKRLAIQWGLPPDGSAARRFGQSVGSWPAFPDAHGALTRLKQRYRLVILSNVDRGSFSASQRQLGVEFDAVYTAEDIGSYKPDPNNFTYLIEAERAEGYHKTDVLHVGQSLFHDHVPASEAGIATCWIQRPTPAGDHGAARPPDRRPRVDFHFTSLAQLADAAGL